MKDHTLDIPLILLTILSIALLIAACSSSPAASIGSGTVPIPELTATDEYTSAPEETSLADITIEDLAAIVAERTPVPSPTPSALDKFVEQVATDSGLAGYSFLGLKTQDWLNLGISALIVLIGSLLLIPLLFNLLKWAVRRTKTQFDDDFLATIGRELRWFVVVILTDLAVFRLEFLGDGLRNILDDLFFLLALGILYLIMLRLVAFATDRYQDHWKSETDRKRWRPILTTFKRLGYLFVSLITLSIASTHFGFNITLPVVVLVFSAVIIAFAARATIADAIAGFVILTVQPFRIDDVILIKELDTIGTVKEIGIQSIRMSTRDNREVIVPNSLIGASQVVNYTNPDSSYRVQIDFLVYGGDLDHINHLIEETVCGVEGVQTDRPVEVLYLSFGGSARELRVRWWVDHIFNKNLVLNRVNRALDHALNEAGIETPNLLYDLRVKEEADDRAISKRIVNDQKFSEPNQDTKKGERP